MQCNFIKILLQFSIKTYEGSDIVNWNEDGKNGGTSKKNGLLNRNFTVCLAYKYFSGIPFCSDSALIIFLITLESSRNFLSFLEPWRMQVDEIWNPKNWYPQSNFYFKTMD